MVDDAVRQAADFISTVSAFEWGNIDEEWWTVGYQGATKRPVNIMKIHDISTDFMRFHQINII